MSSTVIFVFLVTSFSAVRAGWIEDLNGAGLSLGDSGLKLFLDRDNDRANGRSLFDIYSLRMGYSGLGLSLGKRDSKLDFGFYYNDDKVEGRGKKMGELIVPLIMGFKVSTIGSLMMGAVSGLVLKALIFSKLAFVTSSLLGLYKLYGHKMSGNNHVHTTYHTQQPQYSGGNFQHGYDQLQPADFFNQVGTSGYANYPTSLHAEASNQAQQYAVVEPGTTLNATHQLLNLSPQHLAALKRRRMDMKHIYHKK